MDELYGICKNIFILFNNINLLIGDEYIDLF